VRLRVLATDVNPSYGLSWALVGFGGDQTAAVIGYGVYPCEVPAGATEADAARITYEAMVRHGREVAGLTCRPELWVYDARGWNFDAALRFGAASGQTVGLPATPCIGYGWRNYRPVGKNVLGRPREGCHLTADASNRKWVAWNSDYWHEVSQRGWTGSMGAPGSCSLPVGHHREFAEQVCRKILRGKQEVAGRTVWVWDEQPGRQDYGDAMAMAYMAAAFQGIGTGGVIKRASRYIERRRPKVKYEGV
jgi:hypothetical protein